MSLTLPVVTITADTIPEAWERSLIACWNQGTEIRTQYDGSNDPPSKDCMLLLTVTNPFQEPRIHRAMPGGIADLESYRMEVVEGVRDHWINPELGKWQYSYSQRLKNYKTDKGKVINQLDYIVDTLVKEPYSRQAQAVLWQPWNDAGYKYPACLQSIYCRVYGDELVMNVRMRSNDALRAAAMNIYAFTDLQRVIADRVSEGLGNKIRVGQYNHFVDSYHIYGSCYKQYEGIVSLINKRSVEDRTYITSDVQYLIDEANADIKFKLDLEKK